MTQLPNVRLHGLGLTDDFLLQLSDRAQTARIAEARPEGYDLPPRVTLEEAVLSAWENARKLWRRHQEHDTDPWSGWVRPLLRELDLLYGPVPAAGIGLSETGDVPLHFAPAVGTGSAAQPARLDAVGLLAGQRTSPHGLMQSHLNATPGQLWGLVTNGEVLRLLRDNAQVTRPAYAEFDLGQMMRAEDARSFRVLWLLLHRTRLRGGKDSVLEGWNERSKATGARATDSLRDGVERAIEELGSGFLEANGALNVATKDDRALIDELHRASLKMVYQLVFVFVTEDRDLLFARNEDGSYRPDAQARERAGHYLTRALREKAGALRGGAGHFDAFAGWERLVGWLRGGFAPLGLPALGSALFAEPERTELRGLKLSNRRFYAALRALSEITVDGTRRPVNYAGLDSEELGSIYESLLELVPRVEPGPRFALMTLPGNERKTTGSYYTPAGLIELLLESALDPVIEGAVKQGNTTEEKISRVSALKVIDPACGSGHFLIAAARRIGLRLAQLEENAAQPSPAAQRRATRTVIAHCIYGADINPMAVELAKVALWLEAQDAGAPLAFLDHRLRVGNSLLGATPEVMNAEDTLPRKDTRAHTLHVPDDAYKALTGDDKTTTSALKRRNKAEREEGLRRAAGAQGLFDPQDDLAPLGGMLRALDKIEPSDLAHVQAQESTYRAIREHRVLQRQREQADLWCAAFVAPRLPGVPAITTGTLHAHRRNPADPTLAPALALAGELARQYRFLHPHIEFPDVFLESGGFDCVLGNPPWERIKLQEKEWFGTRVPEIAAAPNAAARTRMIAALKTERPEIHAEFQRDLRQAEAESGFIRTSRRYPLTGRGDVNTYAVFTELAYRSINPQGRVGIIVPTGIATDDTTKFFFQEVVEKQALVSLYDFENRQKIFPAVDSRMKFATLALTGSASPSPAANFVFFALSPEDVRDPERRFSLSPQQIALLNPNTRTAPIFRSARDAQITAQIYERVPVLLNETTGENPWGIRFMAMFHMSNDSGLFRTAAELEADGWTLHGNRYRKGTAEMLPLYEAKLMHQFDHRFATYDAVGNTRDMTNKEKADPHRLPLPRYWVAEGEVEDRLVQKDSRGLVTWEWSRDWLMGFRDITNATNERTGIFSVEPRSAIGHTNPVFFTEAKTLDQAAMLSNLDSFVTDYAARQKVGGTHLTYGFLRQFPVLPPSTYTPSYLAFITPRVLELTYTAHDLTGFARALGYGGEPFTWDDERRFWLRAELDALYFILYGIERDDVAYIMDTFPIVRRKDEAAHGRYRTKEAILEVYDALGGLALTHLHAYRSRVPGGAVAGGWLPGRMEEFAPTAISPMVTKQEARDAITELLSQYPELASLEVQNDLYRHRAARSAQNRKEDWVQYIIEYMRE